MAVANNFKHIRFARLNDLLHSSLPHDDEMAYVANASEFRRLLINSFGRADYDASLEISTNEDTCLTYKGYLKFLETDLEFVYPLGPERSKKAYKKGVGYIAKQMLARGDVSFASAIPPFCYPSPHCNLAVTPSHETPEVETNLRNKAFARAVRERFPSHIRLSIHPSSRGRSKIPIRLLPTSDPSNTWSTPWHCTMAVTLDGEVRSAPRAHFNAAPELYELVTDDEGNPSYYREKSDLFSWASPAPATEKKEGEEKAASVRCDPMYPCGILVRPAVVQGEEGKKRKVSIRDVDPVRLRALAERNSPVVLRGFTDSGDRELFIGKALEVGEPIIWRYGLLLEVKDRGEAARGAGNSLTAEKMPFHYDGIFRTLTTVDDEGKETVVSAPPR